MSNDVPQSFLERDQKPLVRYVRSDGKGGVEEVVINNLGKSTTKPSLSPSENSVRLETTISTEMRKEEAALFSTVAPQDPDSGHVSGSEENQFPTVGFSTASPEQSSSIPNSQHPSEELTTPPNTARPTVAPTIRSPNLFSSFFSSISTSLPSMRFSLGSRNGQEDITFVSQGTYVLIETMLFLFVICNDLK